ncbi:MAG TPA: glycosyltransferase family 2 protein [Chromatiaceae bacterium]|nr:glycosyltransferase family 2 protein [Chromatiaceae bacterium]
MTHDYRSSQQGEYKISVVIPNYNYALYIGEALNSVLAQSVQPYEIIVVDDGSTDNSVQIVRSYGDKVRLIEQENQHVSAARNAGIKAAKGNWIALLDSDDLWHPRKLEFQIKASIENPDWSFVASRPDETDNFPQAFDTDLQPASHAIDIRDFITKSQMSSSDALIKSSCFDKTGMFDTSLKSAEDRDMWHRLTKLCKGGQVELPLHQYRKHPFQLNRNIELAIETRKMVIRRLFESNPELKTYKKDAWANHYYENAVAYRDHVNRPFAALGSVMLSLIMHPGNYLPNITVKRFKFMAVTLLRAFTPGKTAT